MNYVGVDLHQKTSWFYVLNTEGNRVMSKNISNKESDLKMMLASIPKPFSLAVETTYNWYFFVDIAECFADKVFLTDAYSLKAFAKRHKKTDKIDAKLIATVLFQGYLPTVFIPDTGTRELREILRCQMNLKKDRSRNIHRLKCLLDKIGSDSAGDFTVYKQLAQIRSYKLPEFYKNTIVHYIDCIESLSKQIYQIKKNFQSFGADDNDIQNLTTIPGIGVFSAALIKTEIIDIKRFQFFNRLCAYAGLAPRVASSANTHHTGPLNRNRRKHLQWILIEIVYHYKNALPNKKCQYDAISKRKGHATARVALARDMLRMIYIILKEKRPFYTDDGTKCDHQFQSAA